MIRKTVPLSVILSSLILINTVALGDEGRPANCLLIVEGEEFLRGECKFFTFSDDGSFQISSYNGKYFAQVHMEQKGIGIGVWNGEPYANNAHGTLGTLLREDACWVNEIASVCAW